MQPFDSCVCVCGPGFKPDPLDPDKCQDIDECKEDDPCQDGERCINIIGGYRCAPNCSAGYENDWIHGGVCKGTM